MGFYAFMLLLFRLFIILCFQVVYYFLFFLVGNIFFRLFVWFFQEIGCGFIFYVRLRFQLSRLFILLYFFLNLLKEDCQSVIIYYRLTTRVNSMNKSLVGQYIKSYTFIREIGKGAWATVYEAIDDRDSNTVAVKVISGKLMVKTPKLLQLVKTEIKVLKDCNSENVIRFVDSFQINDDLYIATQFCNGGDLEQYLAKKKVLSQEEATHILKQILNGFKGLHMIGAMHRDFKVANILLHNGVCKIADLGFAKQMEKRQLTKTILGTSLTMAPEVLEERPYGFQADIWSIGVVYYQLLYGQYPYIGMNDFDILKKIKSSRPNYSKVDISRQAKDFIQRCLTADPKKRINWVQIYSHQLISKKNPNIIYGSLKSKVNISNNIDFYQKNKQKLSQEYQFQYPQFGEFQIQKIREDDIRMSDKMGVILKQAEEKKKREEVFVKYEKMYLCKRNDTMFIFQFVAPFISNFYKIKANHGIAMFILSKKAYLDMVKLQTQVTQNKNIFKVPTLFQQFTKTQQYKNILLQLNSDCDIISAQCLCYSSDIQMCSKQISAQFDITKIISKDYQKLVKNVVNDYWFLLADALGEIGGGERKRQLIRVLQALYYYKSSGNIQAEEFDHQMAVINFQEAEKDIIKKYSAAFN